MRVHLLGELVSQDQSPEPLTEVVATLRSRLADCVEQDEAGKQRLTITLPNREALDTLTLAGTLARLLAADGKREP